MATEFEKKKQRHASGESTVSNDSLSNYIPTPPDGGYGWVVVFASFINHVIVDGISFTFGVFYLEFLKYFGASKGKTALVGSLLCGTYLLTGIFASALTNKFGCRAVCIVGSFVASSAFVLCTFSTSIDILMLTYGVLGGIGFGLVYLPSVVSVSFYFQKRRALATGIAVCGAGVGCFIFAPAGRVLLDAYDWKNAMLIVAALVLNSCVCGMLMRPLEPPKKKTRPRAKNVFDRLKEQVSRNRKESECSACTYSVHQKNIIERVQEIKSIREKMLRDEDSEMGESEMGSVPNSVMNSIRTLEPATPGSRPVSRTGSLPGHRDPRGSVVRQESLVSQTIAELVTQNGEASGHQPQTPSSVPEIVIQGDDSDQEDHEGAGLIPKRKSLQSATGDDSKRNSVVEDSKRNSLADDSKRNSVIDDSKRNSLIDEKKSPTSNGYVLHHSALSRVKASDPTAAISASDVPLQNGSVPASIPHYCDTNGDVTQSLLITSPTANGLAHDKKCLSTSQLPSNGTAKPRPPQHLNVRQRKPNSDGITKEDYARPLYRKDIFYSGSIIHIPQFHSQPDVKTYMKSVTSIPADVAPEKESWLWSCLRIPKSAKDILKEMLDFELLLDPVFMVVALANALGMLGMYVPFIFFAPRAIDLGVEENKAAFLLSVVGITNTIGRVLAGAVADHPSVNSLLLHNTAVIGAGASCIFNSFATTFIGMCLNSAFFGLCIATWISLTSIILVDLLGLEKLTNAFGLLTMVRGIFVIIGPPIAGAVYDATKNYNMSFYVGGALLVLTGLVFLLLHLPFFTQRSLVNKANRDLMLQADLLNADPNIPLPDSDDDDDIEKKSSPVFEDTPRPSVV